VHLHFGASVAKGILRKKITRLFPKSMVNQKSPKLRAMNAENSPSKQNAIVAYAALHPISLSFHRQRWWSSRLALPLGACAVISSLALNAVLDNPRVRLDIFQADSLFWVQHEQSFDQVSCLSTEVWGYRHVALGDSPLGHYRGVFERRFADQEFVRQHTE
jgi:hypothetical protein